MLVLFYNFQHSLAVKNGRDSALDYNSSFNILQLETFQTFFNGGGGGGVFNTISVDYTVISSSPYWAFENKVNTILFLVS